MGTSNFQPVQKLDAISGGKAAEARVWVVRHCGSLRNLAQEASLVRAQVFSVQVSQAHRSLAAALFLPQRGWFAFLCRPFTFNTALASIDRTTTEEGYDDGAR